MEPVHLVVTVTATAALVSALGALPGRGPEAVPSRSLGWANAVAAGLMLGAAFVLAEAGLAFRPLAGVGGVLAGIGLVLATHGLLGVSGARLNLQRAEDPRYGWRILGIQSAHGALEGVAVGVAAVVDLRLGIFLAAAFGVHNVAEATVLSAVLRGAGRRGLGLGGTAVLSNLGQPVLAGTVFLLLEAVPSLEAPALGLSTGALVYLVTVELLPEAYDEAGEAGISLVTGLFMGVILILRGLVLP